jgi:hypothetical protein
MVFEGMAADRDKWFLFEPDKPWSAQTPQEFSKAIEPGNMFSPTKWSPDGSHILGDGNRGGIFVFSLASKRFTRLSAPGGALAWLNDSRRVLSSDGGRLFVTDTVSNVTNEIMSILPDTFNGVGVSSDNRTIYFTRVNEQGDIWLATFK